MENDEIINNPSSVSNILNSFYVNITKDIGQPDVITQTESVEEIISTHSDHASVLKIKDRHIPADNFEFKRVNANDVHKLLSGLKSNKATGFDLIPPKLLKLGAASLCQPLQYLINLSFTTCSFPSALKMAEVVPVFKKGDNLNKQNYRPVSILPSMAKIFEHVIVDQLMSYFEPLFSPLLSGFRKGFNCQNVLMKFVEDCKSELDDNNVVGAILMDLSKAFDCLPHKLLIAKLNAYGVGDEACQLVASYFHGRQQRVKLHDVRSEWLPLVKGAPQGSLFGPITLNMLTNDLLILVAELCRIYNYADDNTISVCGKDYQSVKDSIEDITRCILEWFRKNFLQANPDKFQSIIFNRSNSCHEGFFDVSGSRVVHEKQVKLLGVHIDFKLSFTEHVSAVCKKAGKHLNVLGRLSKTLNDEDKLTLFYSFILSHFNYCSAIWHFSSVSDVLKMEKIQKRALQYVFNDFKSSYMYLLAKAERNCLYIERLKAILIEVYKSIHKLGPSYLHNLFTAKVSNYDFRSVSSLTLPKFNTVTYGKGTLKYEGCKLWNELSNDMKSSPTLKVFKSKLAKWKGPICSCNTCLLCQIHHL